MTRDELPREIAMALLESDDKSRLDAAEAALAAIAAAGFAVVERTVLVEALATLREIDMNWDGEAEDMQRAREAIAMLAAAEQGQGDE